MDLSPKRRLRKHTNKQTDRNSKMIFFFFFNLEIPFPRRNTKIKGTRLGISVREGALWAGWSEKAIGLQVQSDLVLLFQPLFLSSVVKTWADGYRGDGNWGEFRTWVRSGEVGFHGGRHLESMVTQSRKGMHRVQWSLASRVIFSQTQPCLTWWKGCVNRGFLLQEEFLS